MKIGDPPLSPLPAGRQALEKGETFHLPFEKGRWGGI